MNATPLVPNGCSAPFKAGVYPGVIVQVTIESVLTEISWFELFG